MTLLVVCNTEFAGTFDDPSIY